MQQKKIGIDKKNHACNNANMKTINQIIDEHGVTEVAARMGVERSTIWRHRKGARVSAYTALQYQRLYGVDPDDIGQRCKAPSSGSGTHPVKVPA